MTTCDPGAQCHMTDCCTTGAGTRLGLVASAGTPLRCAPATSWELADTAMINIIMSPHPHTFGLLAAKAAFDINANQKYLINEQELMMCVLIFYYYYDKFILFRLNMH